jgi:hypothetical protein
MPNRYEREIEEILRNLEHTEPKSGQRFDKRPRRGPGDRMPRQRRRFVSFHLSASEWLLVIAVVAALVAGGYAYAQGKVDLAAGIIAPRADLITGVIAAIGVLCLILVALSQFLFRARRPRSVQYGNMTVTPLRRNPFSGIKTQWNLLMLKWRYRRQNKH